MTAWDVFTGQATVPPGALDELAALRAALPGYDVTITSHTPTCRFEATRRGDGPGPCCLISSDPADLWRELAGRARPAALDGDPVDRALLMARLTISTCPPGHIPHPPNAPPLPGRTTTGRLPTYPEKGGADHAQESRTRPDR